MKLLVFSILISCMCLQVEARNYYFSSVTGDDNRTMVEAQNASTPWRTLTKLNSVFSSLSPGDSVLFRRGDVFIGNISIGQSGVAGLPVVLGAYGTGAQPVITGLQPATNWTSLGGGLYETTLSRGSSLLNAVTFQDTMQPMGRYPKLDNGNGGYWNLQSHVGTTSITSTSLSGAQNYVGGEVVIRKYGWILDRGTITAQTSSTITYSPFIAAEHPNFTYEPQDGFGFFIQNHPSTLTRLGEWCYNTATQKLTMYFGAASPSSYTVKAAGVENLVDIIGKNYVVLDNLTLSGANSYAVFIDRSSNLTFSNCNIIYTGVNAIEVTSGETYAVKVSNCTLANTNNNAINANTSSGWTIQNNIIRNTGMVRGMGLSGDGHYNALHYIGGNSLVQGNEIRKTGYIGINFVGDYTVIKNNVVDSFCMVKSDGGGIYTSAQSGQAGRRVTGNLVLNGLGDRYGRKKEELDNPFAGNVHGIYMDGGATDVAIDGNTVAGCASSGLELSSPFNVQVLGNTFYNNTLAQVLYYESKSPISNLTVKNNIMFARPAEQLISLVYAGSTNLSGWGTIDSNYYCRPLYEPQGIITGGYPNIGSYTNYPGGGIVQAPDFQFYSLDTWQKLSGVDAHTMKTPVSIPSLDSVRFEYNATNAPRTVVLDATYMDVKGKAYNSGTVTLAPYTSIILIRTGKLLLQSQTISFPALSNKLTTDLPFTLSATASSGLPVSYRVVSGPATVSGNTVTLAGTAGTVVIEASQSGNTTYNAATPVTQSFTVSAPVVVTPGYYPIPGRVEAENYAAMQWVLLESCSEGGQSTGGFGSGSWMDYNVNVAAAGTYTLNFRVGGWGGSLQVKNAGGSVLATVAIPSSGGWQTWKTVSSSITLPAGLQTLRLYVVDPGFTLNWFEGLGSTSPVLQSQTISFPALSNKLTTDLPFTLSATASSGLPVSYRVVSGPATVSGNTVTLAGTAGTVVIEASQSGNTTYNAATPVTQSFTVSAPVVVTPGYYPIPGRVEAENYAAMQWVLLESCSEGGQSTGGFGSGSWMDYNVNVAAAGTYTLNFRVGGWGGSLQVKNAGGSVLATVAIPSSGGWQTWKTVSSSITLPAGLQTLRLYVVDPGFTLNWFEGLSSTSLVTARPAFGANTTMQEVSTSNTASLRLFPLPARSEMTLQLNNTYTGALRVMILDEAGRLHQSLRLQKHGPEMTQRISVNDLSGGVYLLQVEMNGHLQSQTFLKQ